MGVCHLEPVQPTGGRRVSGFIQVIIHSAQAARGDEWRWPFYFGKCLCLFSFTLLYYKMDDVRQEAKVSADVEVV